MSYVSLKYVLSVCHARLSVRGSITAGFETLKIPPFARVPCSCFVGPAPSSMLLLARLESLRGSGIIKGSA